MSIELHNASLKFLNKSLFNLENNKPINFDLLRDVSQKYILFSPYNRGFIIPTGLIQLTGRQKVDLNQVERVKNSLIELIKAVIDKRDEKSDAKVATTPTPTPAPAPAPAAAAAIAPVTPGALRPLGTTPTPTPAPAPAPAAAAAIAPVTPGALRPLGTTP